MQIVAIQFQRRGDWPLSLSLSLSFRGHWRDPRGSYLRARLQRADGRRGAGARAAHLRHLQVRGQRGGAEEPQGGVRSTVSSRILNCVSMSNFISICISI